MVLLEGVIGVVVVVVVVVVVAVEVLFLLLLLTGSIPHAQVHRTSNALVFCGIIPLILADELTVEDPPIVQILLTKRRSEERMLGIVIDGLAFQEAGGGIGLIVGGDDGVGAIDGFGLDEEVVDLSMDHSSGGGGG